jgi:hypothetical protein
VEHEENDMMERKSLQHGTLIELRDSETGQWIPLSIISIVFDNVECRTLSNEPILTTKSALIKDARLRPRDGSCRDCGDDAHNGPCIDRQCAECGVTVGSRCSQHPQSAVHVYRRLRYLAEIVEDKPYPTREQSTVLRRDLLEQMRVLRFAEEPRQGRVMITSLERAEILSALENAAKLIDSLPTEKKRSS